MRHVLPVLRQEAIRWLGRALPVIGLLALLAAPLAGIGGGAPFLPQHAGIGQLEKALPAELRTGRSATVGTDTAPGGPAPTPTATPVVAPPDGPADSILARHPAHPGIVRVAFLRPAAQAPPVAI